MKYKTVKTLPDMQISAVGFGCWGISGDEVWNGTTDVNSIRTIETAIDLGINFFDVAPIYGFGHAEEVLGKALKGKRDKVYIASKCGMVWPENDTDNVTLNLTADSIAKEVEQSLRRLDTDYIDLYQMHWPDPDTDVEESMEALVKLQQAGTIRHIGVTNFSVERTKRCMAVAPVASWQGLYNLLEHNPDHYHNIPLEYRVTDEVLPMVEKEGMAMMPYSPLLQGLLSDNFEPNYNETDVRSANPKLNGELFKCYYEISRKLYAFAQEIDKPLSQLSINWLVQNNAVTSVIAGGQTPDHVKQNAAATDWELTPEMLAKIDAILAPYKAEGLL